MLIIVQHISQLIILPDQVTYLNEFLIQLCKYLLVFDPEKIKFLFNLVHLGAEIPVHLGILPIPLLLLTPSLPQSILYGHPFLRKPHTFLRRLTPDRPRQRHLVIPLPLRNLIL